MSETSWIIDFTVILYLVVGLYVAVISPDPHDAADSKVFLKELTEVLLWPVLLPRITAIRAFLLLSALGIVYLVIF